MKKTAAVAGRRRSSGRNSVTFSEGAVGALTIESDDVFSGASPLSARAEHYERVVDLLMKVVKILSDPAIPRDQKERLSCFDGDLISQVNAMSPIQLVRRLPKHEGQLHTHVGDYQLVNTPVASFGLHRKMVLGVGHYGKVRLGLPVVEGDGKLMAIKKIKLIPGQVAVLGEDKDGEASLRVLVSMVVREVDILRQVSHPNVVRSYAAMVSINHEDEPTCYIAMDYVPGAELFELLSSSFMSKPSWADRLDYAKQIIAAVHYFHQDLKARYCDLKAENIRFGPKNKGLKVIDLGDMTFLDDTGLDMNIRGSMMARAPEHFFSPVILKVPDVFLKHTTASDIFSLGVLLVDVLTWGKHPFCQLGEGAPDEEANIRQFAQNPGAYPRLSDKQLRLTSEIRGFLLRMMAPDPQARPDIEAVKIFFDSL